MEHSLMTGLQIALGIVAAALVAIVFMLASRRQKLAALIGGQQIIPYFRKKTSGPEAPRVVGGFMVGDDVTFLDPNGRCIGWIVRIKGFTRSFVLCSDGELRRVKISRLAAA